jgi:hypothetical protein
MTPVSEPSPVPACVLFLRMRGLQACDAQELAQRREQLAAAMQAALKSWNREQRVVLEAADGLALVGNVAPLQALEAARLAVPHAIEGALGIGLHHGPVRAVADAAGGPRVLGDGLETAGALAGFAATHPVVASQSFRDALAAQAPRAAEDLHAAGEGMDERLRPHALYVDDPRPAHRRALLRNLLGTLGVLLLLSAGYAGRAYREEYEAARRVAVLVLDIRPGGEIFIDGERKGSAPPLARITLPPGPHVVEVRNPRFRPLRVELQLRPGEEMQLKHVFVPAPARRPRPAPPPAREPGLFERFKFW